MPIIRRRLTPDTVYPSDIRYNPDTDTVQSLIDGDWVDNPHSDPRTQTIYPPRLTSDPACDAAQSVADAIKNQIDQTIEAVDNAKTAFSIAGLILGLFTFGVFDIFIALALALANLMLDAGKTALDAALTPTVWHTFACILFCHIDSGGRVKSGEFPLIISDVDDQIGGLGALVLNSMLQIAGEGGVNNLASLGTSTGSCGDCECGCGDETIADTIDVYFGDVLDRDGCTIEVTALVESGHFAVGMQWDGTHGFKLVQESIILGAPNTPDHWQWRLIPDTGPISGLSAPIGVEVQQLVFFDTAGGTGFSVRWRFETP